MEIITSNEAFSAIIVEFLLKGTSRINPVFQVMWLEPEKLLTSETLSKTVDSIGRRIPLYLERGRFSVFPYRVALVWWVSKTARMKDLRILVKGDSRW